ncbi:MAG TPA: SUMF1/EgtB/PvdO family nonheme iron enzyme [Candidatus Binatia bacterium]|nr:SUMF1/EgtB/PvdO family nonheme iron enzyme [Candidatus Binatia bacterium]
MSLASRVRRSVGTGGFGAMLLALPLSLRQPADLSPCPPDAMRIASVCMDRYEASVWEIPTAGGRRNRMLITKIQNGTAQLADLIAGGATQKGLAGGDYPCNADGQNCVGRIFAVSLRGVTPSAYVSWFQAQQACANSGKRLPTNTEWQMAVAGTPDGSRGDDGATDCNTGSVFTAAPTGSRQRCHSGWGVYDMVGNVSEWVGDWVPLSTTCGSWPGRDDAQCFAGAATTGEPGALIRGGNYNDESNAGPLAIGGVNPPSFSYYSGGSVGFRCAR